ncbi:MAG: ATP-binding protein [Clostridia bacterium]|nr:ATP-binding protein [Clostridia bacterium]
MIKKLFREMLLTQIVSTMTVTLCMLIDSIMIGRFLGVDSMSAYGLASPLLLVFAALGSMISAGVQVMCGKTIGKGDRDGTDSCYSVSVFLAAAISAVGLAAVFIFIDPITTLLGAGKPVPDNEVFGLTKDYITGFILGAPAFLCAQIMVPYMQLSGRRTRLVAAVIAMTVSDVAFDLLNVFVLKGGTLGMGLASTLSYYIAFAIGVVYFFKKDCMFRFRLRLIRAKTCRELVSYGVPTVVNQISMVLLVFILNRILLDVQGTVAVAAYSVISTVGNICYCFGSGIGAVAMMLAAVFFAERDRTSIRELVRVMSRSALILDVAVTAVVALAARPLVYLFLGGSAEAGDLAVTGLRLFVLSIVPASFNSAFKNYYQGVGRLRLSELISVLQNFVFTALFAFVLSRFIGITGAWLGFVCGECVTLFVLSLITWRHYGKVSLSADAYSMLDRDFAVPDDSCYECTVQTVEEATESSQRICEFCRERGVDRRMSTLIGLCIEEMTVNIIDHGFTKDDADHNVDVRLVMDGDTRVIRIRDNCVKFDPTKYVELHSEDDPAAHIGIRMVMKTVKEARYINSLGLNNLILVI